MLNWDLLKPGNIFVILAIALIGGIVLSKAFAAVDSGMNSTQS